MRHKKIIILNLIYMFYLVSEFENWDEMVEEALLSLLTFFLPE